MTDTKPTPMDDEELVARKLCAISFADEGDRCPCMDDPNDKRDACCTFDIYLDNAREMLDLLRAAGWQKVDEP